MTAPQLCADCGKTLSATAKVGRCQRCFTRKRNSDPDMLAKKSATMKRIWARAGHRERVSQSTSDTLLGWCPREWRPRYRLLRSRHGVEEAKRRTIHEIEEAGDGFLFQLQRVRNGARIYSAPPVRTAGNQRVPGEVLL